MTYRIKDRVKTKIISCTLLFIVIAQTVFCAEFDGVKALANRRVPWLNKCLVFKKIPGSGNDQFTLSSENGKIVIGATAPNAAAFGLNWYLKYYCHRSMSHMGDNLSPVSPLPVIKEPVSIDAVAPYRYALNYCTYNYTMSFYTWKDWEHELDWMALNGVNVMLVANGTEAIWQNVLKQLNYSDKAISDFITGPAFNAWWLMGNVQGWGGPMPQSQIESRKQLVQKMLQRMSALGIEPVMPAFYGMVPSDMKQKVKAHIITQGAWGAFTRPDIIDPNDPLFNKLANLFYSETKRVYGKNIRFFSGDPFHEGGTSGDADLGKAGVAIQKAMQRNFPGSIWVLQGWQVNPRKEMLANVDKSAILVQELFGENTKNWEDRNGYEGTPFIWCTVTNFGERPGITGKLQRFADEIYRAQQGPYAKYMQGVGIMPEGINNNPVVYELLMELAWHKKHVDINSWIKDYIKGRYGSTNASLEQAWKLLLETAYSSDMGYQEGPPENILCARPALHIKSVSTWGNIKKKFDIVQYKKAVRSFITTSAAFKNNATYKIDAINFVKQDLANDADTVFSRLVKAVEQNDKTGFEKEAAVFLDLIEKTDMLLNTDPYYKLDTYLLQSKAAGNTVTEKRNNLLNALMLVTYWGGNNPKEDNLHEYAYKEWGGMMNGFYKKRWELYFDQLRNKMNGKATLPIDFFAWERNWVKQQCNAGNVLQHPPRRTLEEALKLIYPAL